jgi:2-oxoglutarate ferredoxin oxidoreductase subunit delta
MTKLGKISILGELCKGCYLCVRACPKNIIVKSASPNVAGVFPAVVDGGADNANACIACGACYEVCPDCCITVFEKVVA